MIYNFDEVIDRRGTGSVRWDAVADKFGEPELIPLTTADMDFRVAPPIQEALFRVVEQGIYGYTRHTEAFYDAIIQRFNTHWHWNIQRTWIRHSATILAAVGFCIQAMTCKGDGIVLPTPMYHPFQHLIRENERTLIECPLALDQGGYHLDFPHLEALLRQENVRMLIFCNPHNPVGRAWREEELEQVCRLCLQYDVILLSDEIHCDFVFDGRPFVSAAAAMEHLGGLDRLIVCSSAGKSFNIAGLQVSNIILPGKALRDAYDQILRCQSFHELNMMGPAAVQAAYTRCGEWQTQVKDYLQGTRDLMVQYFHQRIPVLHPVVREATFMIWLDCRELGLGPAELEQFFTHQAKVGVNMGEMFGTGGAGYVRINFASPRPIILESLARIETAVNKFRLKK